MNAFMKSLYTVVFAISALAFSIPAFAANTLSVVTINEDGTVTKSGTTAKGTNAVTNVEGQVFRVRMNPASPPAYEFGHNGTAGRRVPGGYRVTFPGNPEIGSIGQSYFASYIWAPGPGANGYWGENYFPAALVGLIVWTSPANGGCFTDVVVGGATTFVGTLEAGSAGSPGCKFYGHDGQLLPWTGLALDLATGRYCPNATTVTPNCPGGSTIWGWDPGGIDGGISIDNDTIFKDGFEAPEVVPVLP